MPLSTGSHHLDGGGCTWPYSIANNDQSAQILVNSAVDLMNI